MSFSGKTHEECKASKEERREEGLKLWNNCPICEESGFFCDVGRHPIAKVLEEQKLLRLQEQRAARTAGLSPAAASYAVVLRPPPPPVAASPRLFGSWHRFYNVNGDLTTLSEHRGFRNYMRAKALEIGITGCIQRYLHRDVVFYYEGTAAQVDELFAFLRMCEAQEMIQTIEYGEERELRVRRHGNFRIITDHSRTVERRGQVIKGQYSDEEQYDKLSEYSSSSQKLLGSFGNF